MKNIAIKSTLLAAAVAFALPVTLRAAIPPAEKILPADTLVVFSVPDYAKLREATQRAPTTLLWNDAAMKPFRDKFMAKLNSEFIAPLERDLGVKLDDYATLPQGQLTFAITQEGWKGKEGEPGLLVLLDARDKGGVLKSNLAVLRKKWTDAGKTIKTEKIRDVEFSVVPLSSNDVPATLQKFFPQPSETKEAGDDAKDKKAGKPQIVIGQFESLLIMTLTTATADKAMARLSGGSVPALAEDGTFEANRLAVFRDAPMFFWVNMKRILDTVAAIPEEAPNPEAPSMMPQFKISKIFAATGLGGLKTLAGGYREQPDGTSGELLIGVPAASRAGLFKAIAPDAKDSSPPAFVPADVVKFQRWRIDGQKAIATIEKMATDISPQAGVMLNYFISMGEAAAKEKGEDFSVRNDIFGSLGDDIIIYEKAPRAGAAPMDPPPSLVLVGSRDAEKLAGRLHWALSLASPGAAAPEKREFLGKKIYSFKQPAQRKAAPSAAISYGACGGYLAFTTDAAMIEEFIRSAETPGKPLRELAGLADASQKVGGQATGMFAYENQVETARRAFDIFRKLAETADKDKESDPVASMMPFARPEKTMKEWLDFSLLPPFDKVAKYFHMNVGTASAGADGISLKYFAPTPPQLKK